MRFESEQQLLFNVAVACTRAAEAVRGFHERGREREKEKNEEGVQATVNERGYYLLLSVNGAVRLTMVGMMTKQHYKSALCVPLTRKERCYQDHSI